MRTCKKFVLVVGLLLSSALVYAADLQIDLSSDKVARGETFWVHIKTTGKQRGRDFKVEFEDQTVKAMPHPKLGKHNYLALVGVPIEHETGPINFYIYNTKQPENKQSQRIEIIDGDYAKEAINVPRRFTELPYKIKQRVEEEYLLVNAFYNSLEPAEGRAPTLSLPVENKVTSPFGTHRVFNGSVQSYHNGVDLRAQEGTPVKASQEGRVLFTSDLYYAGRHVVVDHGGGVLTTYSHLRDIQVKPGDKITQGEVLGYSGASGRVSGPHLHWVTKVNKVTVNPLQLKELLDNLEVKYG